MTDIDTYDALRASIEYCEESLRERFPTIGAALPIQTIDKEGRAIQARFAWSPAGPKARLNVATGEVRTCLTDASLAVRVAAARALPRLVEALREKERTMREEVPEAIDTFTAVGAALREEARDPEGAPEDDA